MAGHLHPGDALIKRTGHIACAFFYLFYRDLYRHRLLKTAMNRFVILFRPHRGCFCKSADIIWVAVQVWLTVNDDMVNQLVWSAVAIRRT